MRQGQQFLMRRFRPKSKYILAVRPNVNLLINFDHLGIQQDRRVETNINVEMPRNTYAGTGAARVFERFQNINFHPTNAFVFLHTEYFKRATFDLNYAQGMRINYTPAAGLLPFQSHGDDVQANVTLRPSARLKIDETYIFTRMRTPTASVFLNHLTRTRINYQFTRALSLRMIADYNAPSRKCRADRCHAPEASLRRRAADLATAPRHRRLRRLHGSAGKRSHLPEHAPAHRFSLHHDGAPVLRESKLLLPLLDAGNTRAVITNEAQLARRCVVVWTL